MEQDDLIVWNAGLVTLVFSIDKNGFIFLTSLSCQDQSLTFKQHLPLAEVLIAGSGHWQASGRLIQTEIGRDLIYKDHTILRTADYQSLSIDLYDTKRQLLVTVTYQVLNETGMIRAFTEIQNESLQPITLESVTSWVSSLGSESSQADMGDWKLYESDFEWLGENRWHSSPLKQYFPNLSYEITDSTPRGIHQAVSTGSWSTGSKAPVAVLESLKSGLTLFFQIEHNGAWRWEIGNAGQDGYIALSGPTRNDHSWFRKLAPGEIFSSVPASIALSSSFQEAMNIVTDYRRSVQGQSSDLNHPHVIVNDYMNTINGNPTTEKLLPLIKAAAQVGGEVFCIDCGWYDDQGDWWSSVGEWLPSQTRFPHGFHEVVDAIRDKGMIPGLWLEPEVVGVNCPISSRLPNSAFFQRGGERLEEQGRYLLDLSDSAARTYLNEVIGRLVHQYGIGYFKFDYNISAGVGSDATVPSPGDGLLRHNRAYTAWIDHLHKSYPNVILENCSSGGMREDFAQTSRFQVQSTSDQQDYRLYPPVAASSAMMVLPEQAGNWAYPESGMTQEEIAFNLNTSMLGRFFLSGYINNLKAEQRDLIASAIKVYKQYVQPVIARSRPIWPLGLPDWDDPLIAYGLDTGHGALITLWCRPGRNSGQREIYLPQYAGSDMTLAPIFPTGSGFNKWKVKWKSARGSLSIELPDYAPYVSRTYILTERKE